MFPTQTKTTLGNPLSLSSDCISQQEDIQAEEPKSITFMSGAVGERTRWLFEAGKIDSSGNWIGEESALPPLSYSEVNYLRTKLDKALPVLKNVRALCQEKGTVSVKTFRLIGSYVTHILFGMPGFNEEASYLTRLLQAMGIDTVPLDGFQASYQTEPADCDLRGHLFPKNELSQNAFKKLFHQFQKAVDPNREKLENPFDSGIDRFGAIAIPNSICEVILYLNLKVPAVFSTDGLFIPLESLMDENGDAVVVPEAHLSSCYQVVIDHLLGLTKVIGKKGTTSESHLQSLDSIALFRLWSGFLKGRVPADLHLTRALFEKAYAATFGHNLEPHPEQLLEKLCSQLGKHKECQQVQHDLQQIKAQIDAIKKADSACESMATSIDAIRSVLSSLRLSKQASRIKKEMLVLLRSLYQKREGFIAHMDNWLKKHHADDSVGALVYFFNAWSFLSNHLSGEECRTVFLRCKSWNRYAPLLDPENTTFTATLAQLFFRENIPFEVLTSALQSICCLLDSQKSLENSTMQVIRSHHGHEKLIYQLRVSSLGEKRASFHVDFDPLGAFERLSQFQKSNPKSFAKLEQALLPHLVTLLNPSKIRPISSQQINFLRDFYVLDKLSVQASSMQASASPLVGYLGLSLSLQLNCLKKKEVLVWIIDYLAKSDGNCNNRGEIAPLLSILASHVKGRHDLETLLDGLSSSLLRKEALWLFLYSNKGVNGFDSQNFVLSQIKSESLRAVFLAKVVLQIKSKSKPVSFDGQLLINLAKKLNSFLKTRSLLSLLDDKEQKRVQEALLYLTHTIASRFPPLTISLLQEGENEGLLDKDVKVAKLWLKAIQSLISKKQFAKALDAYCRQKDFIGTCFSGQDSFLVLITDLICSTSSNETRLLLANELKGRAPANNSDQKRLSTALVEAYEDNPSLCLGGSVLTSSDIKKIKAARIDNALQSKDFKAAAKIMLQSIEPIKVSDYQDCLIGLVSIKRIDDAIALFYLGSQKLSEINRARLLILLIKVSSSGEDFPIEPKLLSHFFTTLNASMFEQLKKKEKNAAISSFLQLLQKVAVFETSDLAQYKQPIEIFIKAILPCISDRHAKKLVQECYLKGLCYPRNKEAARIWLSVIEDTLKNKGGLQSGMCLFLSAQKNRLTQHKALSSRVLSIKKTLFISCITQKQSLDYAHTLLKELCDSISSTQESKRLLPLVASLARAFLSQKGPQDTLSLLIESCKKLSCTDSAITDLTRESLDLIKKSVEEEGLAFFIKDNADIKVCFDNSSKFQTLIEELFISLSVNNSKIAISFSKAFFSHLYLNSERKFDSNHEKLFYNCLQELVFSGKIKSSFVLCNNIIARFRTPIFRLELLYQLIKNCKKSTEKEVILFQKQVVIEQAKPSDESLSEFITIPSLNLLLVRVRLIGLMLQLKRQKWSDLGQEELRNLLKKPQHNIVWKEIFLHVFNPLIQLPELDKKILHLLISPESLKIITSQEEEVCFQILKTMDIQETCNIVLSQATSDNKNLVMGWLINIFDIFDKKYQKVKPWSNEGLSLVKTMISVSLDLSTTLNYNEKKSIRFLDELLELSSIGIQQLVINNQADKQLIEMASLSIICRLKIKLFNSTFKEYINYPKIRESLEVVFRGLIQSEEHLQLQIDLIILLAKKDVQGNVFIRSSTQLLESLSNSKIIPSKRDREKLTEKYLSSLIEELSMKKGEGLILCKQIHSLIEEVKSKSFLTPKKIKTLQKKFSEKSLFKKTLQSSEVFENITNNHVLECTKSSEDLIKMIHGIEEKGRSLDTINLVNRYSQCLKLVERQSESYTLLLNHLSIMNQVMFKSFNENQIQSNLLLQDGIAMIRLELRFSLLHFIKSRAPVQSKKNTSLEQVISVKSALSQDKIMQKALLLLYQIIKKDWKEGYFFARNDLAFFPLFTLIDLYAQFSFINEYKHNPELWNYNFLELSETKNSSKSKGIQARQFLLLDEWKRICSPRNNAPIHLAMYVKTDEKLFYQAYDLLQEDWKKGVINIG